MVQRNTPPQSWKIQEILPYRQISPLEFEFTYTTSTSLAARVISKIETRIKQRAKYGTNLIVDYIEFKFSAEKEKIRIGPPITHNDFEKRIVDEIELVGRENLSLQVFLHYKYNKNKINGSKDEVQLGASVSPTFTSTTTIPYTTSQMNLDTFHTKESSLTDVPEPNIVERDLADSTKNSLPGKSFYFEKDEKDEKLDTLLYDNTVTYESSEDKKNLCNSNSIETVESNHVGLVNQAMTCYLNSLLQALFMTPEFRNALYNWEYKNNEKDSEANSIPYQLQKLFLNLQTSNKAAVETTSLTKSFGWDVSDSWHQHDIQELCRVMFDALEQKFKNTDQADLINRLYEGKINDYVKCLSCNTEKSREDTFLDIPLPVRPFDNNVAYGSVEEALEAFVKYETLEGSNQYFCEKCDKKSDAHKGLKFTKFPYILTLQLKRFDFDHNTYNRIKLNDRVTFPEILNLNSFIEPTSNRGSSSDDEEEIVENNTSNEKSDVNIVDKNRISNDMLISNSNHLNNHEQDEDDVITMENGSSCGSHNENIDKLRKDYAAAKGPYIYELFSIMIHSGSASGGHYYAYIKDFKNNKWYSFNDQIVSPITKEEIHKTYGGGNRTVYYSGVYRSSTNAYMLMYRQIDPERNTNPMETKDFPPHIKKLLEKMKNEEEQNYREERIHSMERQFKQTIYYRQAQGGEIEKTDITISMSYTLNQVVEAARKKFDLDYKFDCSQCRIVTYLPMYDLVDKTFDGKEECRLDHLFSSEHTIKPLLLDVRPSNEEFQDYPSEPIVTKVFVIDAIDKDLLYCPKYIRAYCKQTVRDYKEQLTKHFHVDLNALQLYCPEILPNKLLEDDFVFESLGWNQVYTISATDSYNEDMTTNFLGSTFYRMHERLGDVITFYIDRKDVTKEQLDNLSIPSLSEHSRDVKNQENISKQYDYHSNNASYQCENQEKTEMIDYYSAYSNQKRVVTQNTDCLDKTDASHNLKRRSKEEGNNELAERRDCKIDDMCPQFRSALNEVEVNQPNKEKCSQQELIDKESSQTSSNQHTLPDDKKNKLLGNNNNNNNVLTVREQYRNVGAISRSLHDLANKDKNEEWSVQETCNSEDSSLSDSDRTLVGDAPEECEFNYDNYDHCPIVMNAANEDVSNEKFFKIENLRSQNLLKISMDINTTEEELKKKLESFLDIPRDYLKLVDYHPNHLDELHSMTYSSTSDRLIFSEDKKYVINLERILNPDENQITIYLLEMDARDILGKLFTTIVKKNATIGSVKRQIIEELKRKPDRELASLSSTPYEKWKFMEIENDTVGKVLEDNDDEKILPESMREICIHQLPRCRENITRIYTMKWNMSKSLMMRWPREEIDVDKNEGFGYQIKKKLAETQNIPEENLEFYPLVASKDIDISKIDNVEWKSDIRPDELDFKTHLLFRDSTDKSSSLTDSSPNTLRPRRDRSGDTFRIKARGLEPVSANSSPRKEKALKIRVGST